ncbi:MAG: glycosyltransferase family 4 protein [candidate division Zixibacteria bacterium]|nr:glycosyltransferase family 4 protein [candidate division Zixibacteria bacterium]
MRILFITQHFPPERGAVRRLYEFAAFFKKAGHNVTVLTALPNYPDGIIPPKYRGKFLFREEMDGIEVYRSYVLPASNAQPRKRMLGFITFLFSSLINGFRIKGKFDLILASSPPVTSPLIGYIFSRLRRTKLILEIRDLQPESGEQFGNLKKSLFTELIRRVMRFLYRRADHIVCVTEGIAEWMRSIDLPEDRLTTIKSGVGNNFIDSHSNGIRKKFGWEDKFLILYAGTLGWAHSLETVVEAASHLTDQKDIRFVFIGEGHKRVTLEKMVREYGLHNVSFIGSQPLESIPYFLRASDVLIESLKDVPITKGTFPCKLFEYMASGRPIIFGSRSGEATAELEKAGGALTFASKDAQELAKIVRSLYSKKIDGENLGKKYHQYIRLHHTREKWAGRYLDLLEKINTP